MAPGRIGKLPLELRLMIYDNCNIYPDRSNGRSYSDPWSDLPRGHDIGTRIDGVAITNLISAFPELSSDLPEALSESQGVRTLVFEDEGGQGDGKDPELACPQLNTLSELLELPQMDMVLRIAVDIRGWNDMSLLILFGMLAGTDQTVQANLICTSVPADLATVAARALARRGGSIRIYEKCDNDSYHTFGRKCFCTSRLIKEVPVGHLFKFRFYEELHGPMHELD